jgi:hypothetical protein
MGKIRLTNIYIYYKIEQHGSTNTKGEITRKIYILRWKIRRTNIYTKGEDQTDKYIYYGGRSDGQINLL